MTIIARWKHYFVRSTTLCGPGPWAGHVTIKIMKKRLFRITHRGLLVAIMVILGVIFIVIVASPEIGKKSSPIAPIIIKNVPKPPPPRPPLVPLNNYGFSANELVWMDPAERARQLENMKAAGVSWVRIDLQWYVVQPARADTYDWSVYDRAFEAISQHGLHILPILDYAPAWAAAAGCSPGPQHKCAPADPQAFAAYAAAAVARYTPYGVTSWEVWNEPNSPRFWYPRADATAYAELLKATYPAIKKTNPSATVITGGLRSANAYGDVSPHDYVAALYAAGAQPYFDALGSHPYSHPALPLDTSDKNGWTQMLKIRDIAVSYGDTEKKIWITEVGATTGGPHPVSESVQAQIVHEAVRLRSSYPWAGPLFWYDYKYLGTAWVSENFFGLVRANGSPKPAYASFLEAIKVYE